MTVREMRIPKKMLQRGSEADGVFTVAEKNPIVPIEKSTNLR
jgi:hypothetical protein